MENKEKKLKPLRGNIIIQEPEKDKIKEEIKSPYKHPFETLAYNKGFVNGKKQATADLINDEIKFLKKLQNKTTSGRFVYETKDIDERLEELKQMLVEKNE